jgi:hypothetical protein
MTTAQYITWLAKRIGGNSFSRTELLDAVNQAQNEILGRDIKYMRLNPDAYIHTIAGTFAYTASSAIYSGVDNTTQYDIRDVKRVYTYDVRNSQVFAYGRWNRISHRPDTAENVYASDEIEISADFVPSIAPNSSDCKVNFWTENDPGTGTTLLRVIAYRWPTQLLSEQIALSIPDQYQRGLLKYAILKDLEYTEYGSADKPEELYEKELKKFDLWANKIPGTAGGSTPPREV